MFCETATISDRIVAFGRLLRRIGLAVGSQQVTDALRAVCIVGVRHRNDVQQALFAVFVSRREEIELFDEAFALFWRQAGSAADPVRDMLPSLATPPPPQRRRVQEAVEGRARSGRGVPSENPEREVFVAYSAVERLRRKDFAACTADEAAAVKRFIRDMHWPIAPRRVRRLSPRARGHRIHLRSTLRHNMRFPGEIIDLRTRGPAVRPRRVVVLCDISGSMEPYARMLLHFMHAVTCGLGRVESFAFGTRLTRITRCLQRRDVDEAVARSASAVNDWAGGTRIGEALREFNYRWLRRVLRSGGVVLVISDGCDTGDAELLSREAARLRRNCHRLIWLNPLLRYEAYEPRTQGMQAALPHVSDFLPVHNLQALEHLGTVLSTLGRRCRSGSPEVY